MTAHAPRLLVHTSIQSIRWGDMDMMGHVNNTVYFRYMEQTRIEWFYAIGARGGYAEDTTGPVIVNASCTFQVPLVYPGDIEVRMFLAGPGRSSVGSHYEIRKDGICHAEGTAKIVWIDLATGRPTPLPEAVTGPLRALAASS